MNDINVGNRSGEYFQMGYVVGDATSELQLREMEIVITYRNSADAAAPEAQFAKLFKPYEKELGITEDDIDDELAWTQVRWDKLRKQGRDKTPKGRRLQKQISTFARLVELRRLMKGSNETKVDESALSKANEEIAKLPRYIKVTSPLEATNIWNKRLQKQKQTKRRIAAIR